MSRCTYPLERANNGQKAHSLPLDLATLNPSDHSNNRLNRAASQLVVPNLQNSESSSRLMESLISPWHIQELAGQNAEVWREDKTHK